ncbi:hypothetical protein K501DRAFT_192058 [Backusella circina FSU 941]|nr:hypothetical protein K501DRAFT_192058 [Backusella circina FSU 941]
MYKVRQFGLSQMSLLEMHYPYLRHTLPEQAMTSEEAKEQLNKIEKLANWLDNAISGSPVPIGLDAVLGFIPVFGGAAGALFSFYQIYMSTYFGIPLWLFIRMVLNIFIDWMLSFVPVIGGMLHLLYKANAYNYQMLNDWLEDAVTPRGSTRGNTASDEISWTQLCTDGVKFINKRRSSFIAAKV